MNLAQISSWIEQIMYVVILLSCLYGVVVSYKSYKTLPGADLLMLGFLVYVAYTALAIALPGLGGSYFHDFTLVGDLSNETTMHFLSLAFRLGLVIVIIGLYRVGRHVQG